jgi:hypothetical protein
MIQISKYIGLTIIGLILFNIHPLNADPPQIPARISGTLSINGTTLTDSTARGFHIYVTKSDGTSYSPEASDTDGLSENFYTLYIPFSGSVVATQGEEAKIHVSKSGVEATITSPVGGVFTVGEAGSSSQINIQGDIDLQPGLKIIF